MKIKTKYYCLVDNNNKPDFRFIFTNRADAQKKYHQIKNSLNGETLFVSKQKRDFFVDGIKRNFISKTKPIDIKKGCWATMTTKKVSLLDTIKPETYFEKIIKESQQIKLSNPILGFENTLSKSSFQKANLKKETLFINTPTAINSQEKTLSHTPTKKNDFENQFSSTFLPKLDEIKKITKLKKVDTKKHHIQNKDSKYSVFKQLISQFTKTKLKTLTNNYNTLNKYSFIRTNLFALNFITIIILCGAIIFYANFSANKKIANALSTKQQQLSLNKQNSTENIAVLGIMDKKNNSSDFSNSIKESDNIDTLVFNTLKEFEKIRSDQLEKSIKKMVAGTPMEKMAPYIAKKDKIVAAFLIGIAKKESNYGRRVPVLNGKDCYNYWGYRGKRKRMGTGGHTCFDSPKDAVETVGGRIERLVKSGVDTPKEMVLWKCGSNCNTTGGWPAAHKWIRDVNMYYTKLLDTAKNDEQSSEKVEVLNEIISS